MIAVKRR